MNKQKNNILSTMVYGVVFIFYTVTIIHCNMQTHTINLCTHTTITNRNI